MQSLYVRDPSTRVVQVIGTGNPSDTRRRSGDVSGTNNGGGTVVGEYVSMAFRVLTDAEVRAYKFLFSW